ncbi:MAG: Flp family type IVb pilin [Alphaproteobacteria bacterium]
MKTFLKNFVRDESGVTAMEYGMIAALIAVVILGVLQGLGTQLNSTFFKISSAITAANS